MDLIKWIDEKTKSINEELESFFSSNEAKDRLQSMFTQPIFCDILSRGNDFKTMRERKFNDPEEVLHCLNCYQSIIAGINRKVTFIPSIENFCMFMGWTAKVYKQMLTDTTPEIMEVMELVNDYLIENQLSAGQTGSATASITKFRAQAAGDHGQGIVTQKDQNEDNRKKDRVATKEQLEKELERMGFKAPKQIAQKTSKKRK